MVRSLGHDVRRPRGLLETSAGCILVTARQARQQYAWKSLVAPCRTAFGFRAEFPGQCLPRGRLLHTVPHLSRRLQTPCSCEQKFPYDEWGEDKYMTNCLESLGSRAAPWKASRLWASLRLVDACIAYSNVAIIFCCGKA